MRPPAAYAETAILPEDMVFPIVKVDDTSAIQGSAVFVHARKGLMLTAYHVARPDYRILIRDKLFEFKTIAAGNNQENNGEDWALIKVVDENWPAFILPSGGLIYSFRGGSSVQDTVIVTVKGGNAIFPTNAKTNLISSGMDKCDPGTVLITQVTDYDQGDSGSPMFFVRDDKVGIVAVTSRWNLDATNSDIVEIFKRLRKGSAVELTPTMTNAQLRQFVKDYVPLNVVPVKCIVDDIATRLDALRKSLGDPSPEVKHLVDYLAQSNWNERDLAVLFSEVKTSSVDWIDALLLWDALYKRATSPPALDKDMEYEAVSLLMLLKEGADFRTPIGLKYKTRAAPPQVIDAASAWGNDRQERADISTSDSPVLQGWITSGSAMVVFGNNVNVSLPTRATNLAATPSEKIAAARRWNDLLADPEVVKKLDRKIIGLYSDLAVAVSAEGVEAASLSPDPGAKTLVEAGVFELRRTAQSSTAIMLNGEEYQKGVDRFLMQSDFSNHEYYNNWNGVERKYDKRVIPYLDHLDRGKISPTTPQDFLKNLQKPFDLEHQRLKILKEGSIIDRPNLHPRGTGIAEQNWIKPDAFRWKKVGVLGALAATAGLLSGILSWSDPVQDPAVVDSSMFAKKPALSQEELDGLDAMRKEDACCSPTP